MVWMHRRISVAGMKGNCLRLRLTATGADATKGFGMSSTHEYKEKAVGALKQFYQTDMRWSYWVIAGLVAIGIVASFFKGGWALYPILFAAGVLSMIQEAADRNGQGVPPLYAYGFLIGIILLWVIVVLIFSFVHPVLVFIGMLVLAYQLARGYLQERERTKLIETRRAHGECIHCGFETEEKKGVCPNCGEEPDPTSARLRRVASIVHVRKNTPQARGVLGKGNPMSSVKQRENALIARRQANRGPMKRR
jgi:hypothetical protein